MTYDEYIHANVMREYNKEDTPEAREDYIKSLGVMELWNMIPKEKEEYFIQWIFEDLEVFAPDELKAIEEEMQDIIL
jgi:hypothetical protein